MHVLRELLRVLRLGGLRVDAEVHHDLGAECLAQLDGSLQPPVGRSVRGELDVLDVLGPDAEDHAPADVVLECRPRGERLLVEVDALRAGDRGERAVRLLERRLEHVHRRRADEPADEEVDRLVVERLRVGDLLQLALAHDRDAMAHGHRLDLVVRDVDRRHAEVVLELRDLGARLHAQLRVEVRQRLVHEERRRLAHDRAAHRDALALPARERARLSLQVRLEAEDVRSARDAAVDLVFRDLLDLEPERDVLVHR